MKSKKWTTIPSILLLASLFLAACGGGDNGGGGGSTGTGGSGTTTTSNNPVTITMWTKEGAKELDWVKSKTDAFHAKNPTITITVVNKDVEKLRQELQSSAIAGSSPDLLWTVNDHVGPFVAADLIQPVDNLFDASLFSKFSQQGVDATKYQGKNYGLPISVGNDLMLYYNKKLVPTPPADSDAMIKLGKSLTKNGTYGLVYNQTEAFWFVPFPAAFGGNVIDGRKPTLDSPAVVQALQFLHDLKYKDAIIPSSADYNGADTLFKTGKAAMIINGDWAARDYQKALGDNVGATRIPKITATGKYPAPFISGSFFEIPKATSGDKLNAAKALIQYFLSDEVQIDEAKTLIRIPALTSAQSDPSVTGNALLKGSADQISVGQPSPNVPEIRAVYDAIKPSLIAVYGNKVTPEQAAKDMQKAADAGVQKIQSQ